MESDNFILPSFLRTLGRLIDIIISHKTDVFIRSGFNETSLQGLASYTWYPASSKHFIFIS